MTLTRAQVRVVSGDGRRRFKIKLDDRCAAFALVPGARLVRKGLAKLAEAERDAKQLTTDESFRAGQAAGLELAQRIVREQAGLPVEADSGRV
ncbi:hypothetical protein [Actinokineospora pegani]|uniref:hypothetical protein n=1 Tax=Actinokineospora pegani TaxID=2654637 RepID=UPI0012EA9D71|nr:hypothetical protein [Actinokineospora pegani]